MRPWKRGGEGGPLVVVVVLVVVFVVAVVALASCSLTLTLFHLLSNTLQSGRSFCNDVILHIPVVDVVYTVYLLEIPVGAYAFPHPPVHVSRHRSGETESSPAGGWMCAHVDQRTVAIYRLLYTVSDGGVRGETGLMSSKPDRRMQGAFAPAGRIPKSIACL